VIHREPSPAGQLDGAKDRPLKASERQAAHNRQRRKPLRPRRKERLMAGAGLRAPPTAIHAIALRLAAVTGSRAGAAQEGHHDEMRLDCLKTCQDCGEAWYETFHYR
jgi:hypothetical protein